MHTGKHTGYRDDCFVTANGWSEVPTGVKTLFLGNGFKCNWKIFVKWVFSAQGASTRPDDTVLLSISNRGSKHQGLFDIALMSAHGIAFSPKKRPEKNLKADFDDEDKGILPKHVAAAKNQHRNLEKKLHGRSAVGGNQSPDGKVCMKIVACYFETRFLRCSPPFRDTEWRVGPAVSGRT